MARTSLRRYRSWVNRDRVEPAASLAPCPLCPKAK